MNKMLAQKIKQITEQVNALEDALRQRTEQLDNALDTNERLQREKWGDQKEINTLRRVSLEYDELKLDHDTLAAERDELRHRLTGILEVSKALHESIQES